MNEQRVWNLKTGAEVHGPVAYWMSRDQRSRDNWALVHAQKVAISRKSPLLVVFSLANKFLGATERQYDFMFRNLREVEASLSKLDIPFFLLKGPPGSTISDFAEDNGVSYLVTDFDPLRIKRDWKKEVIERMDTPIVEVDAHNIVPCWMTSGKQEYGAYTIRPKIKRMLPQFLDQMVQPKKHPYSWSDKSMVDWDGVYDGLELKGSTPPVGWLKPGEEAALSALREFVDHGLVGYDIGRNDPTIGGQSGLSPYLHFGQLSAQRVALEVNRSSAPQGDKAAFLEELIVRRELSDNFCFYNPSYDSVDGFPNWARTTLEDHRADPREYLYTLAELEKGMTHDDLWNAAQMEMVRRGKMHGYMRMYWAKKILEWTSSPEEAMEAAIFLNDRYELDGRDPNGYAGIAWSLGGVHDRAWGERPVFGKIRYMSRSGAERKFDVQRYVEMHLHQDI